MGIAKVTRNYQVTIPRDIRKIKDIQIGDTVFFAIENNKIDFFKMERKNALKEIAGTWKGKIKDSSSEYVKNLRKCWRKRTDRLGI